MSYKDEWEVDLVLKRNSGVGRMDLWIDNCNVLKGVEDVVVIYRKDELWRMWVFDFRRECYEMKELLGKRKRGYSMFEVFYFF